MTFSIENEFKKLIENKWLNQEQAEEYLKNKSLINSINNSTSPKKENIFNALKLVPFDSIKVLILGQDPYPNPNHAHGLAFSSNDVKIPSSLKNIFIAIDKKYGSNLFKNANSNLENWAKQGVLLLNTALVYEKINSNTLDKKEASRLQNKNQKEQLKIWKPFIKDIIKKILTINNRPIAMFLWGDSAHKIVFDNIESKDFKQNLHKRTPLIIPNTSIMILQSAHPSPLSVNTGGDFMLMASEYFGACDEHLGKDKITWGGA